MGLLDNLKPIEGGNSNGVVNITQPYMPGDAGDGSLEDADFKKWEVGTPNFTTQNMLNRIRDTPKIATEGIESGNNAADALFNNNTSTFSRALSSKAAKFMATSKSTRTLDNELHNIQRQQLQQGQNMNDLNDMYKLKRQNFAGQLKFAAEMSNYYNQLSIAKLQAIGDMIGGGMSMMKMGMAAGG